MKTFNDFFPHVFVINLARQFKQRKSYEYLLNKYNINYQRFDAIDGKILMKSLKISESIAARLGCKFSHLQCINMAKHFGWKSVLVLEDDIFIHRRILELINTEHFINTFPEQYDIIKLGYSSNNETFKNKMYDNKNPIFFLQFGKDIPEGTNNTSTTAMAYGETIYDVLLGDFKQKQEHIDVLIQNEILYNDSYKCYTCEPNLFTQNSIESTTSIHWKYWSNIKNRINANYTKMHEFDFHPDLENEYVQKLGLFPGDIEKLEF